MKYMDSKGNYYEENSKQDELLDWMYNHTAGRILLKILIRPGLSKAAGKLLDSRLSTVLIKPFIRANHISMRDYVKKEYGSYNDFFTRNIRPKKRPIAMQEEILISPSDGKVSAYRVDGDSNFLIKHTWYNLKTLLKNTALSSVYQDGICVVIRLTVDDYHRYCYVDDGHKGKNHKVAGVLHTVNPVSNDFVPVFKENAREYTTLFTKNFGAVTQIEVGALMVGKITNHHQAASFHKGEEKGYFEFGGSTIILLIEKGYAEIRPDLLENTKNGCETIVKMGEEIGKRIKKREKSE